MHKIRIIGQQYDFKLLLHPRKSIKLSIKTYWAENIINYHRVMHNQTDVTIIFKKDKVIRIIEKAISIDCNLLTTRIEKNRKYQELDCQEIPE